MVILAVFSCFSSFFPIWSHLIFFSRRKTSLKASIHARTCSRLWFHMSWMELFNSGSSFLIPYLNFDWKSAKITIFRLIYSQSPPLLAWISLWLSISISSILWRPFWMVICIRKTFYRRLTIENRDRMSQIRPKSGNNGSKTKALPIFFCVAPSFHSWIFLTHNLMRLIPENIMTTGSKLRIL